MSRQAHSMKSEGLLATLSTFVVGATVYFRGETLGEGGQGTVVSAVRASDRGEVVVKLMTLESDESDDNYGYKQMTTFRENTYMRLTAFLREVSMQQLVYSQDQSLALGISDFGIVHRERAEGATLTPFGATVVETRGTELASLLGTPRLASVDERVALSQRLIDMLSALHTRAGVAHLDVKPHNILLLLNDARPSLAELRFIDFTSACVIAAADDDDRQRSDQLSRDVIASVWATVSHDILPDGSAALPLLDDINTTLPLEPIDLRRCRNQPGTRAYSFAQQLAYYFQEAPFERYGRARDRFAMTLVVLHVLENRAKPLDPLRVDEAIRRLEPAGLAPPRLVRQLEAMARGVLVGDESDRDFSTPIQDRIRAYWRELE